MIAEPSAGVRSDARLDFAVAGGRTQLLRQHVGYPFHITRPFYLDRLRPDLATLYLQSAAGGLYRGDKLNLDITLGQAAAAAVTTQSATIVHDCQGSPARQGIRITLAKAAVALFAPDPLVLFPGANIESRTELHLGPGSSALLQEGFGCHDPANADAVFSRCLQETIVHDAAGAVLVAERTELTGDTLGTPASPLGPWKASGTTLLLGASWANPEALERSLDALGCYAGIGLLPNRAGMFLRLLAPDGGTLTRGLHLAFNEGFRALIGVPAALRRK